MRNQGNFEAGYIGNESIFLNSVKGILWLWWIFGYYIWWDSKFINIENVFADGIFRCGRDITISNSLAINTYITDQKYFAFPYSVIKNIYINKIRWGGEIFWTIPSRTYSYQNYQVMKGKIHSFVWKQVYFKLVVEYRPIYWMN